MTENPRGPGDFRDKPSEDSPWEPGRIGGFAPIEDYAVLGNGVTVALVAADGQIDWWPLPTVDAPPVFAALLDPDHGGRILLCPDGPFRMTRRYVGCSNVLETTFHAGTGTVRVTDALTVGKAGRLPWGELVRRIDGITGVVAMRWVVEPGDRFNSARPWTEQDDRAVLLHVGDQQLALRCSGIGPPDVGPHRVSGSFEIQAGSRSLLAVTATNDEPLFIPAIEDLDARVDATVADWERWSDSLVYDGPWETAVRRSALVLKTLLFAPTGAIVAAPTTSLPERLGGEKNWDYRYMWIRDASFALDALIRLRLHEEVHAAVSWMLGTIRATAPDLKVFYKLDGTVPDDEEILDARGYRDSRPVRSGNSAATQSQLGTFGDLFETFWHYVAAGHVLDPPTGRLLEDLADRCCDLWRTQDAGMWELHTPRHYTISKIGCWVALDRAVRLARRGGIATGHADRWAMERDGIKAWVDEHCWSAAKSSYTFYAGTEELDAATLLAGHTGFDKGKRLTGTVAAVQRELARGPLVYRYTGMDREEGAFLACSFWLVNALAVLGRHDEAGRLMDDSIALANDVGLLSEQMNPQTGSMLGNFPQGLSHLALINAACAYANPRSDLDDDAAG